MTTTKTILEVEAFGQLDNIAAEIATFREGPLTRERALETLSAIGQHVQAAVDACAALALLEDHPMPRVAGARQ